MFHTLHWKLGVARDEARGGMISRKQCCQITIPVASSLIPKVTIGPCLDCLAGWLSVPHLPHEATCSCVFMRCTANSVSLKVLNPLRLPTIHTLVNHLLFTVYWMPFVKLNAWPYVSYVRKMQYSLNVYTLTITLIPQLHKLWLQITYMCTHTTHPHTHTHTHTHTCLLYTSDAADE